MNYWEIRTFSKIKVPIRTKKLELVPIKTCPKIKDPCRHYGLDHNFSRKGMRSLFLNLIAEPIGPRTDTAT